jgi:predicted small secreted protein
MRAARLALVILITAAALSTAACTNPMGPKPAGDATQSSGT